MCKWEELRSTRELLLPERNADNACKYVNKYVAIAKPHIL